MIHKKKSHDSLIRFDFPHHFISPEADVVRMSWVTQNLFLQKKSIHEQCFVPYWEMRLCYTFPEMRATLLLDIKYWKTEVDTVIMHEPYICIESFIGAFYRENQM